MERLGDIMQTYFSIGQVSKLKKLSVKTLRYYHDIDLLIPAYIDLETNYRYYSIDQLLVIDLIKEAKTLGFSLDEIKQLMVNKHINLFDDLVDLKVTETKQAINDLEERLNYLLELKEHNKMLKELDKRDTFKLKAYPKRLILTYPLDLNNEIMIRNEFNNILDNYDLNYKLLSGILYDLDTNLQIKQAYLFIEVSNKLKLNHELLAYRTLSNKDYLEFSYQDSKQLGKKLLPYLIQNNLKIAEVLELDTYNDLLEDNKIITLQIGINHH